MKYFTQTAEEMEEFAEFIEKDIGNVQRVIGEVMHKDLDVEFMVHAKAETVEESAENTDVEAREIVKTLVFIADDPVAVLCPGDTSVSEEKLEEIVEGEPRMANPQEVKESTGYYVGGVSPFDLEIRVLMEETLLERDRVKPAAGSRVVGMKISPEDLREISGAETADMAR